MQNEFTPQELNTAYDEAFHIITVETLIYAKATLFVVFDNGPLVLRHQRCSQAPSGDRVGRWALNRLFPGFTSQSIIQKKVKKECCVSETSLHVMTWRQICFLLHLWVDRAGVAAVKQSQCGNNGGAMWFRGSWSDGAATPSTHRQVPFNYLVITVRWSRNWSGLR